jgi:hypothetical protein
VGKNPSGEKESVLLLNRKRLEGNWFHGRLGQEERHWGNGQGRLLCGDFLQGQELPDVMESTPEGASASKSNRERLTSSGKLFDMWSQYFCPKQEMSLM